MIRLTLAAMLVAGTAYADPSVAPPEDRSWHLLQRQYDGLIRSVQHGLTRHECEAVAQDIHDRNPLLRASLNQPTCPADDSKVRWSKWHTDHPSACGCTSADGHGSTGWCSFSVNPTDIVSAECFQ